MQYGLVAQEVEKLFPDAVYQQHGYKSINYQAFTSMLIKEVQTLKKRLNEIEP